MSQANSIRLGFAVAFFVVLAPAPSSAADLAAGELLADKGAPNVTAFVVAGWDRI